MPTLGVRLQHLVDDVLVRLSESQNVESAFALGGWLATLLWKNHSQIYRLDELETTLLEMVPPPLASTPGPRESVEAEVHLATEIFRSGGHSPLMAHLIRHADRPVKVLLTRMQDTDTAAQVLGVSPHQVQSAGHLTDSVTRLHELVRQLVANNRVIASLHPNDVLGAVALRMAKRLRSDLQIGFVNHADHVYSAGIGAADTVFEISTYGWSLREVRQTESCASFMGIPIKPHASNQRNALDQGGPSFLSGGSPYKFRPLPGMSLPPVLSNLLASHPDSTLTVLGPKGRDWWWWPLRIQRGGRVRIQPAVPKEQYQQLLNSCTIYIDSHPIPGGTALPEALMAGCDVAGIQGVVWGYSPADELLSPDPQGFLDACKRLLQQDATALTRQEGTRTRCRQLHDPAAVRHRLEAAFSGQRLLPPFGNIPATQEHCRLLESVWNREGRLIHPGRKECPQAPSDQRWLARRHLRHFGLFSWSTLKILFYAYVRA